MLSKYKTQLNIGMYNLQQMARSRNWRVHNESQFQRLDLSQAPEIKEKYINNQALPFIFDFYEIITMPDFL